MGTKKTIKGRAAKAAQTKSKKAATPVPARKAAGREPAAKRAPAKSPKAAKSAKAPKAVKARKPEQPKAKEAAPKARLEISSAQLSPAAELQAAEDMRRINSVLSSAYVRQMLIELGGENALAIIRNFSGNLSDDDLAKRLKLKISDVRATLNRLHNEGLVRYMRDKDNETGWYSYSWSLNRERIEKWVEGINGRNPILAASCNGNGEHYFCRSCGAESVVAFEAAAGMEFKCPECKRMLEFMDEQRAAELEEAIRAGRGKSLV